jgi:hypothetical protein
LKCKLEISLQRLRTITRNVSQDNDNDDDDDDDDDEDYDVGSAPPESFVKASHAFKGVSSAELFRSLLQSVYLPFLLFISIILLYFCDLFLFFFCLKIRVLHIEILWECKKFWCFLQLLDSYMKDIAEDSNLAVSELTSFYKYSILESVIELSTSAIVYWEGPFKIRNWNSPVITIVNLNDLLR